MLAPQEARKVAKEREKEREAADKLKRANEKLWEEVNLLTLQVPSGLGVVILC